jgi:putative N-acetyltransferase (TIGR04045 family)
VTAVRTGVDTCTCRAVGSQRELALHLRIRADVFVREQGIFTGEDLDRHDERPDVVHVLGFHGEVPAGTVRFYPLDDAGTWQGDRLAVLPEFRLTRLGVTLVWYAVRSAGEVGGSRMLAHVQLSNVGFFEQLGWRRDGDVEMYVGRPHQPMSINLTP